MDPAAQLLNGFEFDRQPMTVPAGNVSDSLPLYKPKAVDDVLGYLIERVASV